MRIFVLSDTDKWSQFDGAVVGVQGYLARWLDVGSLSGE